MGMKIAVYDFKSEKGFMFENDTKGIGDFLIKLNTELKNNDFDLRLGKIGEGYKTEEGLNNE